MARMNGHGWTSTDGMGGSHGDLAVPGVRWRRRGNAIELNFDEQVGGKLWRRNVFSPSAIPAMRAIGWGIAGFATTATVSTGWFLSSLVTDISFMPWGVALLVCAASGPVAGVIGYFQGRRKQRQVRSRISAENRIDRAITTGLGSEYRAAKAKSFSQKLMAALRTGQTQRANVLSLDGYHEFRIDPVDGHTVRIEPVEPTKEIGWFNQLAKSIPAAGGAKQPADDSVTAEPDHRMALLEERLEAIRRTGEIDSSHMLYPKFVTLQVDRITEYHQLSARVSSVAALGTTEAQFAAYELVEDLENVIELMRVGVDELEDAVIEDAQLDSRAHLIFLHEKYDREARKAQASPPPAASGHESSD